MRFLRFLDNLRREESGQDLVEYALVLAAVAFAVVAGSGQLASTVTSGLALVGSKLTSAINLIS